MSVYGYFVLTTAGYILKLEFVRKMVGFYGQVCFRTHLSGKTHLFLDKICLKVYSEACPEDKPVRASSRTYFERILGAYFERMAGCLSGSVSGNQFREAPVETRTDVRSPIVKTLDSKVMMTATAPANRFSTRQFHAGDYSNGAKRRMTFWRNFWYHGRAVQSSRVTS